MIAKRLAIPLILIIAAGLLGAGLSQGAVAAQEEPPQSLPAHLSYDGLLDMPHLPPATAAVAPDAPGAVLAPEYAAWSRLVFQSARNGKDWEVFAAQGDGSEQVNLTNDYRADMHPRLNRGATRVVFASRRFDNYDIYVMNADGSDQTRLTDHATDEVSPAWSPDGSRIVFQAYRDGQAEIYVMNADGSSQARLTNYGDYDGEPAWSPDGSQIAFVRRVDGKNRIWAMNADGSNPHQLSNQASSENPAWSPDGSQIAYDADGNGDGWQEIWLMDAAGGNQRQVYQPSESNTDAWVRSWSPEGRYIAFTRISFVQYQGNWYWTTAYLDAWDSQNTWNVMRLSYNGDDWHPDWQKTDLWPPTSGVLPLPAQSPSTFTVKWAGTDAGESGIQSYDVQVKEGVGGAWTDWFTATNSSRAEFNGIGGHPYYFRARARDNAGNVESWPTGHDAVTTVESLPPVTAVRPLPAYTRGQTVLVQWDGSDPGASGIAYYEVQVQDADGGAWTDWRLNESSTSVPFTGTAGHTYRFRVRGVDNAQNVEPWPPGHGDAQTTLYSWAIRGVVRNSSGAPVCGAPITTSPAAMNASMSDVNGAFIALVGAEAPTYTASISKAVYGSLPSTAFSNTQDAQVELVLPPADNVVLNWGFEDVSLQPNWQTSGALPAAVTTTLRHTGNQAARLGESGLAFTSPANLTNSAVDDAGLQMIPDGAGGIRLFWYNNIPGEVPLARYAWRAHDGTWLVPPEPRPDGSFAIGPDGAIHVVGRDNLDIVYRQRPPGGSWSAPIILATTSAYSDFDVKVAVSTTNMVHVVWLSSYRIYWSVRDTSGAWTAPRDISGPPRAGAHYPKLALAQNGDLHVVWDDGGNVTRYVCRPAAGNWSPPKDIRDGYVDDLGLAVDLDGKAHVVWTGSLYAQGSCQGAWSAPEPVGSGGYPQLAVDSAGTVHLLAFFPDTRIQYFRRPKGGSWSAPLTLEGVPCYTPPNLAVDDSGTAHVLWSGGITGWSPGTIQLYYARLSGDPAWSAPVNVSGAAQSLGLYNDGHVLAVEGNGRVHAGWFDGTGGISDLYYARSIPIEQAGDAILSQTITVPASPAHPGLSFLYRLGGASGASGNRFDAAVTSGAGTTTLLSRNTDTADWTHRWFDLQPWAGQALTLKFTLHQAAGQQSAWGVVDEITVGSAHPDAWVGLAGRSAAPPGAQLVQTITYGNRGGVTASSAQVTLQLPSELIFVGSDPAPSTIAPVLRWGVGNLAAGSEPGTIRATLQVAPAATFGATLVTTATITSDETEIEQANNTAQAETFVGYLIYLPVIRRY